MKKIQIEIQSMYISAKRDKQREVDEWHMEALEPARRRGCGGRWDPAPRLGAEQQLSQPGLHEHRPGLLRSAKHLRANRTILSAGATAPSMPCASGDNRPSASTTNGTIGVAGDLA